jgi:hypothetical protein
MSKTETGTEGLIPKQWRKQMPTDFDQVREDILQIAMAELSRLRQETFALPERSQIDAVIEAIDFYETEIPKFKDIGQLIEWSGRAIADVTHEVAAAQYGWESPQADAIFDHQERELNKLLVALL